MQLFERSIIKQINKYTNSPDVLVIHGARQVGKTSILKYIQNRLSEERKNTFFIDLEDSRFTNLFNKGVSDVVKYLEEKDLLGKKRLHLFIDEIQYLNDPSSFLKLMHDQYSEKIKLFVSGSSSFEIKTKFKNSLVGRTLNFEIYPLSFEEYLLFKGYKINLNKNVVSSEIIGELKELFKEFILYGGYPRIVLEKNVSDKETYLQQIIDTYIRKDIRDLANIKDVVKFNKLLEVLASQSGQMINVLELSNTANLSRPTIEYYLFLMENTYIIKLLRPFSMNLRSELFKTPKIYFYDTGIVHLLWLKSFPKVILGNMFETSIYNELIKARKKEEIFYWRTQDKKEIDFVLRRKEQIIPIEAKLSSLNLNYSALNYFRDKYNIKQSFCITLEIEKKIYKNIIFYYPWEISKKI